MMKLYVAFPKVQTLSELLSWSHYIEILKGNAPLETGFYVILIKSCLFILFPKCTINAAVRKQNSIPYFLGQLIYVVLYQHIIFRTFRVRKSMCVYECGVVNTASEIFAVSTSNHNLNYSVMSKETVVSYSISTSNHNRDTGAVNFLEVVSYSISTSNHNLR